MSQHEAYQLQLEVTSMQAPHIYTLWTTLNLYVIQYEQTGARLSENTYTDRGMWWRSWLRHCATSWEIMSLIPEGVELFIDIILLATL
jgi:hypothetical protein